MPDDTPADLKDWLGERGLAAYWPVLEENEVDIDAFFDLDYGHLQEMGFAVGARLKLLKAIAGHRDADEVGATGRSVLPLPRGKAAERRQITAMFCDIVGYTNLSSRIDPEETRRLLKGYWQRIEEVASAHQGHIAQYLGDGALIYFGYPLAQEDDAEKAVTAALALLGSLADPASADSLRLHARIGIATGLVVVGGDRASRHEPLDAFAVGPAVNLASRLQALALPGNVVVDESTRQLVAERFDFEPLGKIEIAGLDAAPPVHRVIGVRKVRTRFEARHAETHADIFGRAQEMAAALDLWRQALGGAGRMLLVEGEPGIGKSHFAWDLARRISGDGFEVLRFQCSPHHSDSPFYPLVEGLSALAGITPADSEAERTVKQESLFAFQQEAAGDDAAALASLFTATPAPDGEAGSGDPDFRRRRTFAALVELFAGRSRKAPLLIAIEDLHWCDPTTLEVLGQLLAEIRSLPVLIVATTRSRHGHGLAGAANLCRTRLARLSPDDTKALVLRIFDGREVPVPMLDFITARTDGVPLFIEELAKTVRGTGMPMPSGAGLAIDDHRSLDAIPNSLKGILMERLDTLGPAKRVAQIAACIGRGFDAGLLGRIADLSEDALARALQSLVASELVFAGTDRADGGFSFKHALVCDAAYSSLLLSERRRIHGAIAAVLASPPHATRPEILAHHLTEAESVIPAIEKWQEAAIAAKLRSANNEAVAHIGKAMRLLDQLKNETERNRREFSLLIELIAPYRAIKGFAAREVAEVTDRAILLADQASDVRGLLPLLYNQWVFKFVTAHRDVCQELAEAILARSLRDDDAVLRMTGLRALAATDFTRGRFEAAVEGFRASLALYAAERQADVTRAIGLDALVAASGYSSLACWCLGRGEEAAAGIERALSHAERVAHASTTAFAVYHHALLMGVLERNAAVLTADGRRLEAIGQEQHFVMWTVCGRLLRSMGACLSDTSRESLDAVIGHLTDFQDMGVVYRPAYEAFIAEAWLRLEDREQGLVHIARARRLMEESGERWIESEIWRLEGDLHLLHAAAPVRAAHLVEQAAAVARAQGARRFEARAAESLARLAIMERPTGS